MGEPQDAVQDEALDDPVTPEDDNDRPAELRTAFARFIGAGALGVVGLVQTSLGTGYLWDWSLQSGLVAGVVLVVAAATTAALMRATWNRSAAAHTVLTVACRITGRIGVALCVLVLFLTPVLAVDLDLIDDIGIVLMEIAAAFGCYLLISGARLLQLPHVEDWFSERSE